MDTSEFAPSGRNPAQALSENDMQPGQWFQRPDGTIVRRCTPEEMRAMNARREEASRGKRASQVLCRHDPPHVVNLDVGDEELSFRAWLKQNGRLDAGYCETYYPLWLRDTYRANVGPLPDVNVLDADVILEDILDAETLEINPFTP